MTLRARQGRAASFAAIRPIGLAFTLVALLAACSKGADSAPVPKGAAAQASPSASLPAALVSPAAKTYTPVPTPAGDRLLDVQVGPGGSVTALLSTACGRDRCLVLSSSTDGGRRWSRHGVTAIPAEPGADDTCRRSCGATKVLFVSGRVGYLFAPGLYVTHDGGKTWEHRPGSRTLDMVTSGGALIRLTSKGSGCPGPCGQQLERLNPTTGLWKVSYRYQGYGIPGQMVPAGKGQAYALFGDNLASGVLHPPTLLRTVDGGRRWFTLKDGCAARGREAFVIAAMGSRVALLCDTHRSGQEAGLISPDRGETFAAISLPSPQVAGLLAFAGKRLLAAGPVGISGEGTVDFTVSTLDRPGSWQQRLRDPAPLASQLASGLALVTSSSGEAAWIGDPFKLWLSPDDGSTWKAQPVATM